MKPLATEPLTRRHRTRQRIGRTVAQLILLPFCASLLLTGCKSYGPRTLPRDRFSYSEALADSWKNQLLLNIIKTRYLDPPIYLDVGQIVSGYTLERSASIGGGLYDYGSPASPGNNLTLGGAVRFADSPTITYTPLTGENFLESFLGPVEPGKVFALIQAGYAADFILELSVDSLNGLRNRPVYGRLQAPRGSRVLQGADPAQRTAGCGSYWLAGGACDQ